MTLTKRIIALVLATGLSLAFGLVVFELLFGGWIRTPDGWRAAERLNLIRDRAIVYDATKIYGDNAPPVTYSRDSYGLRGSCPDPVAIDVVTIGGSTTDQRYISDGETWQDVLQEEIRTRTGDEMFCVTNAGIDGHSTYGHIASLHSWFPLIPDFKPSTYIIYAGINDAGFRDGPSQFDSVSSWKSKSVLWRIARTVKQAWESRGGGTSEEDRAYAGHALQEIAPDLYTATSASPGIAALIQANTEAFRRNMELLLSSIREAGGTPVCVSQPHQFVRTIDGELRGATKVFSHDGADFNGIDYDQSIRALNVVLEEICPTYGGLYINLTDAPFNPGDYYDWVHMTPQGAKRIGTALAHELTAANE